MVANEKTISRIHLIGTLLIVLLITVALAGYYSWQNRHDAQLSFARIEQALNEQTEVRLKAEMRNALNVIEFTRNRTEDVLRESIMLQVDNAMQVAEAIHARESPRRPAAEVRKLIIEALRPVRFYDGRGYFFIDDMHGQFILLPTAPQMEGRTVLDNQDDTGHFVMRGLIEAARKPRGEGFSRYRWYRPDNPKVMADKLAYVRHFAPYDWLIGTGDYLYKWEEIQKAEAISRLRAHRFGETGYTVLIDNEGRVLLSLDKPASTGQTAADLSPLEAGIHEKLKSVASRGGGIMRYEWPHPETGKLMPKTAYVQPYAPWQWIVVTTLFDDEARSAVATEKQIHAKLTTQQAINIVLAAGAALLLGLASSWGFSRWMRRLFESYHLNNLAQQAELRQQADELRVLSQAIEQSPASTLITDIKGRIEYVNPRFEAVTGYTAEEVKGHTSAIISSGKMPREAYQTLWETILSGKSWHGELHNRRKDGTLFWEQASISPIVDSEGKPTRFIAVKEDITARKQFEFELQQHRDQLEQQVALRTAELTQAKEAAEAASRSKSTFLANMSHELRTPMNAIMGMTDLAIRRATDGMQLEQLSKVKIASSHLLQVINDILDISKIEAERLQLEHIDFRLGEVIDKVAGLIGHQANQKGLELRVDVLAGVSAARFTGDPLRLAQILLNLAGNALKFTERGNITLRCRCTEETPESTLLRWEVIDTGIGIDQETQERLFVAFEQADSSMSRKYGGTGLGLTISKCLVEMMGGEIGIESTPGQGSTFWFTTPLHKAGAAPAPAPLPARESAETLLQREYAGTRILLAEDEPINQEVAREMLEDVGLVVDLAEDGQQAVEKASQNRYALILMDIQMPVMNGLEAARAIRADSLNRQTTILSITANAFDEDRQICLDAGMNDHIAKPIDPDRLYEMLLAWLERGNK